MHPDKIAQARACLEGAESNARGFPETVSALMREGFEGYGIDFRAGAATYYMPDGDSVALPLAHRFPVASGFRPDIVKDAVREAREMAPGYSYPGFCRKVTGAGCVSYLVSFSGRRVLYVGQTGKTHTELFPN